MQQESKQKTKSEAKRKTGRKPGRNTEGKTIRNTKSQTEKNMDSKNNMLLIMKVMGEERGDWHDEEWEEYGIDIEDAKIILEEYEKKFPEDA